MKKHDGKILFHYQIQPFYFPKRSNLKKSVVELCKKEGRTIEHINYVFCTDESLLQINKQYLKHSTYTDIITFGLSADNQPLVADIYISVERVRENAKTFQTDFLTELSRVIFHGVLHLCGYKDKSAKDAKLMRKREDFYLSLYVSRGTQQL